MPTPDWYLDEVTLAGPEHLDPDYVAGYDAKARTDPAEDVATLREHGLTGASTLIDLGAGTGTLALAAAPFCRRVVAVGVSPVMLERLAAEAARLGITNIEAVQAGFLSYQHDGGPADAVYSRNALHHLPDFWKVIALGRVAAMLRPGGTFLLRDLVYDIAPGHEAGVIDPWLAGAATDPAAGWTRAEYVTHLQDEYSTYTWLLEPMLERTGFRIARAEHRGIYAAYTCVRAG